MTAAPTLREAFGIGPDSAAEMMIVAGDNPTRVRSEPAFAKRCGACPVPASSAVTHRHRLCRGGHRQANAALYRIAIVRSRKRSVLNPIELCFGKLKPLVRTARCRSTETLWPLLGECLAHFTVPLPAGCHCLGPTVKKIPYLAEQACLLTMRIFKHGVGFAERLSDGHPWNAFILG